MKNSEAKYGLWEDGKRIEWFEPEQVKSIEQGRLDYCGFFRKPESAALCGQNLCFGEPPGYARLFKMTMAAFEKPK